MLPILVSHCGKCLGAEKQEDNVRSDQLSTDFVEGRVATQTWRDALNTINVGEMPPRDEAQLRGDHRETFQKWTSLSIQHAVKQQQSTGRRIFLRRLNRDQYQNTMLKHLGLDTDDTRILQPDGCLLKVFEIADCGSKCQLSSGVLP